MSDGNVKCQMEMTVIKKFSLVSPLVFLRQNLLAAKVNKSVSLTLFSVSNFYLQQLTLVENSQFTIQQTQFIVNFLPNFV